MRRAAITLGVVWTVAAGFAITDVSDRLTAFALGFLLPGGGFLYTGHPILLPGNPLNGSVVMVAEPGAEKSCYSVNHGAGRCKGRKAAIREFDQQTIDDELAAADILSNCRQYPKDEAPAAYKDFDEVLKSVKLAGLASTVAKLKARFVIKDADESLRGAA